jgi:hypothetical protein
MPQVQGHGEVLWEPRVRPHRNELESVLPYNGPSSIALETPGSASRVGDDSSTALGT